jgi:hypothetical protein
MARNTSELGIRLPCPLCGRLLVPAALDSTLTFYCKSGHEMSLVELLRAQSASVKGGLEVLLEEWNRQHLALLATVEDARGNGFLEVAEIFQRHAKSLESRIAKVREAYSQSESSKLINLAEVLRSARPTS